MTQFVFPDWFFLPKETTTKTSTTAGSFDAAKALTSREDAWVSTTGQNKSIKKKKICISDYTLEQEYINILELKLFVFELIQDGFDVFISSPEVKQLNLENLNTVDFYDIRPEPPQKIREKMLAKGVSADELVLLDARNMQLLIQEDPKNNRLLSPQYVRSSFFKLDKAYPLATSSNYNLDDVFNALEQGVSITISYKDFGRYKSLSSAQREKVSRVIITDDLVYDNYEQLREIFPKLEEIYVPMALFKALEQFTRDTQDKLKLILYSANQSSISWQIRAFAKKNKIEIIALDSLKPLDLEIEQDLARALEDGEQDYYIDNMFQATTFSVKGRDYQELYTPHGVPLPNIVNFYLRDLAVEDCLPQWLSLFPNLEKISLSNCSIKQVLVSKDSLTNIKDISLYCMSSSSTNNWLRGFLEAAPNLKKIILERCDIEALDIPKDSLQELEYIDLRLAKITKESLNHLLAAAPNLKEIYLSFCNIETLDIPKDSLKKLENIHLDNATISIGTLKSLLEAAPNLKKIDLSLCNIEKDALVIAKDSLKILENINLDNATIPIGTLKSLLEAAPNLKKVNLSRCNVEPLDITRDSLKDLECIILSSATITDESLNNLLEAAPNLKKISLHSRSTEKTIFPKGSLQKIADILLNGSIKSLNNLFEEGIRLNELVTFNLDNGKVNAQDLKSLIEAAPLLHVIDLRDSNIEDVLSLSKDSAENLEIFNFHRGQINGENLYQLLKAAPNLRKINLAGCKIEGSLILNENTLEKTISIDLANATINAENLHQLLKAAPNLREINLAGCKIEGSLILNENALEKLISIDLAQVTINAETLNQLLKAAPNLRKINLACCKIEGSLILNENALEKLTSIDLTNAAINAENLHPLLKATPNLREIRFASSKIEGQLFLTQNALKKLTTISLGYATINFENLKQLLRSATNLRSINLSGSKIYGSSLGQNSLEQNSLEWLTNVELSRSTITAANLAQLLQAAPNIVRLRLDNINGFIFDEILFRDINLTSLKLLELDYKLQQDTQLMSWLRNAAPNCNITFYYYHDTENTPISESDEHNLTLDVNNREQIEQLGIMCSAEDSLYQEMLDSNTGEKSPVLKACTGTILPIVGPIIFAHARERVYHISPSVHSPEIAQQSIVPEQLIPIQAQPEMLTDVNGICSQELIRHCIDTKSSLSQVTQKFTIQPGKKYKLKSSTPMDILQEFKVMPGATIDNLSSLHLEYCKDNNFYYISADNPCEFTAKFYMEVLSSEEEKENSTLTGLIKYFQSFPMPKKDEEGDFALTDITEDSSGKDRLEAIYAQKKGACRHRVGAFLHRFEQLKGEGKIPRDIQARGADGAVHAWIEISYDNGYTWHIKDLGGYPAPLQLSATPQDRSIKQLQDDIRKFQKQSVVTSNSTASYQKQEEKEKLKAFPFATTRTKVNYSSTREFLNSILPTNTPLSTTDSRILLEVSNPILLEKVRTLLYLYALTQNKPIFTIDQYSDLLSSKPSIAVSDPTTDSWEVRESGSYFSDFLDQQREDPKILLVDWSKLNAAQMVSVNGLVDDHERQVDSVKIPDNVMVLGLITPPIKPGEPDFISDASFTSRHKKIIKVPFSEQEIEQEISVLQEKLAELKIKGSGSEEPIEIDLYNSPNWSNILFGQCTVNGSKRERGSSPFILALEEGRPIVIKNGPWDDHGFAKCISDLELTGELHFYNQKIKLRNPIILKQSEVTDFGKLTQCISQVHFNATTTSEPLQANTFVVNSATLERCFITEQVIDGKLIRTPGWLARHAHQTLTLLVSDDLNVQQWTYLLEVASQNQVALNLKLSSNVALTTELLPRLQAKQTPSAPVITRVPIYDINEVISQLDTAVCFTSNDPDCLSAALSRKLMEHDKQNVYVLDITELGDEDLLYRYMFEKSEVTHEFKFSEKISQIWEELNKNPNAIVILKGNFSKELLSHLGSLFLKPGSLWQHDTKENLLGQLVLISAPDPKFDFIGQHKEVLIEHDFKVSTLLRDPELASLKINSMDDIKNLFSDGENVNNLLLNKPYLNIKEAVKYACLNSKEFKPSIADALTAKYLIATVTEKDPLDLEAKTSNVFASARIERVNFVLENFPTCLLESVAGTGKSNFIREYGALPGKTIFYQHQLFEWVTQDSSGDKILFIDEANLAKTDWMQFAGLYDDPPTIFIDGKIYNVSKKCKVIFAQNPINYGGGREIPKLFADHPTTIVFPPMSAAYIYHKILFPILIRKFNAADSEIIARNIFKKYDLSDLQHPEKSGITARILQYDALKYCATKETAEILVAKEIHNLFHVQDDKKELVDTAQYVITPSRREVDLHLRDLIQIQSFRQSCLSHHVSETDINALTPVLYGGQNALLLEGAPGVGKSELIKELLKQRGFLEIGTKCSSSSTSSYYYFIPASMNITKKLKLLEEAFKNGSLVVCEEINSSQILEKHINSYLMGEDINGKRPEKPGFMLMGTYNSASLSGRALLSPALKSRAITLSLPEYTKEELMQILLTKYINLPASLLYFIVEQFLMQQEQATRDLSLPMPTFRDLLKKIDEYIESLPPSFRVIINNINEYIGSIDEGLRIADDVWIYLFCISQDERQQALRKMMDLSVSIENLKDALKDHSGSLPMQFLKFIIGDFLIYQMKAEQEGTFSIPTDCLIQKISEYNRFIAEHRNITINHDQHRTLFFMDQEKRLIELEKIRSSQYEVERESILYRFSSNDQPLARGTNNDERTPPSTRNPL